MKQNLTLKLEGSLLYQAKIAAAKKRKSLSQLVREFLTTLVSQENDEKGAAKNRLLKASARGLYAVEERVSRDELHER